MNDTAPLSPTPTVDSSGTAKIIYYLYLASIILGITNLIGVIMAYLYKGDAPDWLKTHYRFQIRTFWILMLYSFISFLLTFIVIGFFMLIGVLIWFVIRCVKGLKQLGKNEPIPNPTTWWI